MKIWSHHIAMLENLAKLEEITLHVCDFGISTFEWISLLHSTRFQNLLSLTVFFNLISVYLDIGAIATIARAAFVQSKWATRTWNRGPTYGSANSRRNHGQFEGVGVGLQEYSGVALEQRIVWAIRFNVFSFRDLFYCISFLHVAWYYRLQLHHCKPLNLCVVSSIILQ